jgi:hypothetical protein
VFFSLFKTEGEISTIFGSQKDGLVFFVEIRSHPVGFSEITSENHFYHVSFC